MIKFKKEEYFKSAIVISVIVIFIFVIVSIILKYQVEGENKDEVPFKIENISVVSTADGLKSQESNGFLWNGRILQINDVYVKIIKNEHSNKILKTVEISNIRIIENPIKGNISISRISKNEDTSNKYIEENLKQITYNAEQTTSLENLTIANQGGTIGFRTISNGLGMYSSNEPEINYDGRILKIENIKNEEIQFKVYFEINIEVVNGIKYKTKVELDLPKGNITESGTEISELDDIDKLIYKRY